MAKKQSLNRIKVVLAEKEKTTIACGDIRQRPGNGIKMVHEYYSTIIGKHCPDSQMPWCNGQ